MKQRLFLLFFLWIAAHAFADDFLDRIRALPGVTSVVESTSSVPDTRFFVIQFQQPLDHNNPNGAKFQQRLTLLHRSETLPMVLALNGYFISTNAVSHSELSAYVSSNELQIEHRFFAPSIPKPVKWQFLTIEQSAADDHGVVESFKKIYSAKWVSTGVSKGGMTTVYYRYFYPDDVDASVPYVAPSSHGVSDPRYIRFVNSHGTAECRDSLRSFQNAALKRRNELLPLMKGTFNILGKDRSLEFSILELPFIFLQYYNGQYCTLIPQPNASAEELAKFLNNVGSLGGFEDPELRKFGPYFFQAATQLGAPANDEANFGPLLKYSGQDVPAIFPPLGVTKDFDPSVMPAVEQWVLTSGKRFIFIYGYNDPWSAGAFKINPQNDSYRFFVTGLNGNHGSTIWELVPNNRAKVLKKLADWLQSPGIASRVNFRPQYQRPSREELFLK